MKAKQEYDTISIGSSPVQLKSDTRNNSQPRTIFEEILSSRLPLEEKSIDRLSQEGVITISAGSETVGRTLTCGTFHLLDNPDALRSLKKELLEVMPDASVVPNINDLEQLPFLVSGFVLANVLRTLLTRYRAIDSSCQRIIAFSLYYRVSAAYYISKCASSVPRMAHSGWRKDNLQISYSGAGH